MPLFHSTTANNRILLPGVPTTSIGFPVFSRNAAECGSHGREPMARGPSKAFSPKGATGSPFLQRF